MKTKTIVIDDTTYVIGALKFGQGKELFTGEVKDINTPLLTYSLNNADNGTRTSAEIDNLPYTDAMRLLPECLDINGMRATKPVGQGEEPAAPVAAG
jgi:hypothetical protein